jgi:hypothetical protein
MKISKKVYIFVKTHIFVCFILLMNFNYASTTPKSTQNSKESSAINENTKLDKNKDNNNLNNSYNEIMSTKTGCSANCCAGNNAIQKIDNSKKKSNKQKVKKKFSWFSRSN